MVSWLRPIFVPLLVVVTGVVAGCSESAEDSACDGICECPNRFGEDCQAECAADFDSRAQKSSSAGCEAEYEAYINCFGDTVSCDGQTTTHDCRQQEDALAACETS